MGADGDERVVQFAARPANQNGDKPADVPMSAMQAQVIAGLTNFIDLVKKGDVTSIAYAYVTEAAAPRTAWDIAPGDDVALLAAAARLQYDLLKLGDV